MIVAGDVVVESITWNGANGLEWVFDEEKLTRERRQWKTAR